MSARAPMCIPDYIIILQPYLCNALRLDMLHTLKFIRHLILPRINPAVRGQSDAPTDFVSGLLSDRSQVA